MNYTEMIERLDPMLRALKPGEAMVCLVYQPGNDHEKAGDNVMCASNMPRESDIKELVSMFLYQTETAQEVHIKRRKDS